MFVRELSDVASADECDQIWVDETDEVNTDGDGYGTHASLLFPGR